jgi:hypothetical protein
LAVAVAVIASSPPAGSMAGTIYPVSGSSHLNKHAQAVCFAAIPFSTGQQNYVVFDDKLNQEP